MGKFSKQIIDALKAAKVPAKLIERSNAFIDEAHDFEQRAAKEVEAATLYVCGVSATAPDLSNDVLERKVGDLVRGLSKGRELDAWDLRALDIIARAKQMYWFWELDSWLDARNLKFP